MTRDEAIWFYEVGGERRGPVSGGEILERRDRGELHGATLVWREGLADWIPFSASELAKQGGPPALPQRLVGPPPVPRSAQPFVPREARQRAGFRPRVRDCHGRAWDLLKGRFWPLVGCFALVSLLYGAASQFYLPVFFLTYPLMGGLFWYILRHLRGKPVSIDLLFEGFRRQFAPLAIMNLIVAGIGMVFFLVLAALVAVLVAVGIVEGTAFESRLENPIFVTGLVGVSFAAFALLMAPLLILAQVGNFAALLILDCGLKAGEALSMAWNLTKAHLFKILVFAVLNAALTCAGLLALYFGVFITGAWASIALVYLYEDAFGEESPRGAGV